MSSEPIASQADSPKKRDLCRAVGVLMRHSDEACMHRVYAEGGCLSSHYSAYFQSALQDRQTAQGRETYAGLWAC